ncbi:hypothetical protein [[Mycoplasma] anseris]|uniref:Uncharacterized protein n=1 Tax=[Mycoplasma] anseris TaxID=92400 RepID=A0A2Z4NCF2_9BACT|nr:hypothetical protein [[Mycoplasma] anseris]AWX69234.1 hypothetical protein DP065_00465 [[Mycoplasma] anseris]
MLNGAINYDATFIKHLSKNFTTKIYNYLIAHEWKLAIDFIKTIEKRYSVNLLEYAIHKMIYRIKSFITL